MNRATGAGSQWTGYLVLAPLNPLTDISSTIACFDPISLTEMDAVKLQDRVDTKYVLAEERVAELLLAMQPHYRLLEVGGQRGTGYRSLYFDTQDLKHYRDHHNKRTLRSKVRFREYLGTDLVFLEVKRKTGRGRTDKARMRVERIPEMLSAEQALFVQRSSGHAEALLPALWNRFTRYTFVAKDKAERLTLDVGLHYSDGHGEGALGGIVVAELKQSRADRGSAFVKLMASMGMRPMGMSKYCIGMITLHRVVKHNAFKEVLLKLQRLRKAA